MPLETQQNGQTATSQSTPQTQSTPGAQTQTGQSISPASGQQPSSNQPQQLTPDTIFQEYEDFLTQGEVASGQSQQGQSQGQGQGQGAAQGSSKSGRSLNPKRKYEGLSEEESWLFNDMSTPAYEYLYPRYLKSRDLESELEKLRGQLSTQQESSFYDQEGAWKITPDYERLSTNISQIEKEQQFWKQQLAYVNDVLAEANRIAAKEDKPLTDILNGITVDVLVKDGKGGVIAQAVPISFQTQADIMNQLNYSQNVLIDLNNKIEGVTTSFKSKHQDYTKTLADIQAKMFAGFPAEKLQKLAAKKLEMFPAFARNRPENKLLANAWVLFDAFIHMLNKNKTTGVTQSIKNGTAANNVGSISGSGGAGTAGDPGSNRVEDIIKQFNNAGLSPSGR